MKKLTQAMIGAGMATTVAFAPVVNALGMEFPDIVPPEYNHIWVSTVDGGITVIDGRTEEPDHFWHAGFHLSRDGSPPPWERSNGQQHNGMGNQNQPFSQVPFAPTGRMNAVRVSEVPEFMNNNIHGQPSNGLIEGVVRRHVEILLSMNLNLPQGVSNATHTPIPPEIVRWYTNMFREIIEVWDQDPGTGVFGVNRLGMMAQLNQDTMSPFSFQGDFAGWWTFFCRNGFVALDTFEDLRHNIDAIVHTILYELFGRGEGYEPLLSHAKAFHLTSTGGMSTAPQHEFIHQLGNVVGLDTIFAWGRQGDDVIRANLIHHARSINPSLVPELQRMTFVNDNTKPYFDPNRPEAGVRATMFFDQTAGFTSEQMMQTLSAHGMIRPEVFPELRGILAQMGFGQQAQQGHFFAEHTALSQVPLNVPSFSVPNMGVGTGSSVGLFSGLPIMDEHLEGEFALN